MRRGEEACLNGVRLPVNVRLDGDTLRPGLITGLGAGTSRSRRVGGQLNLVVPISRVDDAVPVPFDTLARLSQSGPIHVPAGKAARGY